MPDMLVPLLKLPPLEPCLEAMQALGIVIRRANAFESSQVQAFVRTHFGVAWADEVLPGILSRPGTVVLAVHDGRLVGFAAFECTRKAFFGPTGVAEADRGKGIGKALLIAAMWGLRELGYVYGIIGGAGPTGFYERTVGAAVIPDSSPGIYVDLLKAKPSTDA